MCFNTEVIDEWGGCKAVTLVLIGFHVSEL